MKTRKLFGTIITCALLAFGLKGYSQSISQSDLYNYIRTTWNVTSLSDSAIQQLLNQAPSDVDYDGIPYENLIGAMIETPQIVNDMNAGDFRGAGLVVLNYAQDQLFDASMEYLGVASISFPVEAASWPLNASLTAFANAVKQDAFNRQCRLYFAARAYNTPSAITNAGLAPLLQADQSVVQQGFLTETDDGWLYTSQGAYLPQTVPGYTSAQFYQFAETLYQIWINRNSYSGDQSNLRQAFLADALPQAPTIYQQPVGGSYAQGGSLLLSVGASGQQPFQYQWLLNGTAITGANNSTYSVQSPNAGNYSVTITDNNNLTTTSESVTVNMLPTGSTVVISAPANNATLSGSTTVQVTAPTATSVAFYLDGLLQITDSSAPFSWNWNTATADGGQHTLTAKAYNSSTLIGTSAAIQVTLNNTSTYVNLDTNGPNSSSLTATPLPLGSTNTGYIYSPTAVHWYQIQVTNVGTLTVSLSVPTNNDFDLELYGPNASWVAGSYNPVGQNEQINYSVTQAGTYYARTYGYPYGNGSYSTNQPFQISAGLGSYFVSGTNSGPLVQNTIWSGIVYVSGDVTIGTGTSLTILPGTIIQCQPDTDTQAGGINSSRVEIIVNGGTLNALGTAASPILFTSAGPVKTPGDWYGIRMVAGNVTISNTVVEYANDGIRFENNDTRFNNYALGNVTVQRCSNRGVYVNGGQYAAVTLNNFQLWTNAASGLQSDGGPVTLVGGLVTGNSGNGISCGGLLTATGITASQNASWGISANPAILSGCVVNQNGNGISCNGGTLVSCLVTGNHGDGVSSGGQLFISGCTLTSNSGWGLNARGTPSTAEAWNNLVQSNGSGGMSFSLSLVVGVVSNTISGNSGNGLNLSFNNNWGNTGVSASGITGNAIYNNGGVGVEVNANSPSALTISGNDIYQNTGFELRNDSGITIIANNNYWGEPTTDEFNAGQLNLSRIYDSHDNAGVGQVLIQNIRTTPALQAPHFITQPQTVTALPGDTITLSASVSGTTPIAYQWYQNGGMVSQATSNVLTLPNLVAINAGNYYLVAANAAGQATSMVAQVNIILPPAPPVIVQNPVSQTVSLGASVSFAVAATGTGPFTYQWNKDSAPIAGANAATFSISSVLVSDAAAYTVTVSNPGGNATSQPATLTVNTSGGSVVTRQITRSGTNFLVTVTVVPPVATPAYIVEEFVPTNFTVLNVSSGGSLTASSGQIEWGIFWDGLTRTVSYTLVPPPGFTGTTTINGAALFFGATATTGGDNQITMIPQNPTTLSITQWYGYAVISINGTVGSSYRLEASTNTMTGTWQSLGIFTLPSTPYSVVDWDSPSIPNRFYRTVLIQ